MTSSATSPVALPRSPYAEPADAVAAALGVDPGTGLTQRESDLRRESFGANRLARRPRVSEVTLVVRQLLSPVVALLAAAMGLSIFFGEWHQAIAIGVVLLINTAIGYFTERRAVRSMEALRALGGTSARVRRDGRSEMVSAESLVPGDVVLVEAGDVVTADLRCVGAAALAVDESALTGESIPVDKGVEANQSGAALHERSAMMFKGTHVVRGSGEGIVVGTGLQTELGRITALVETTEEGESPLGLQLKKLSRQLVWVTLLLAAVIALAGSVSGRPIALMVETSIALAVAAIPEGLPIVATITLARGMLRMARRNALVENLAAVETLGSTSVVLTDKTGTLTENRMEVERLATPAATYTLDHDAGALLADGHPVRPDDDPDLARALVVGVLCGNAELANRTGDPMEVALLQAGMLAGLRRDEQLRTRPEVAEYPFDPATKVMITVHRDGDGYLTALKGAPEVVLGLCGSLGTGGRPLSDADRGTWLGVVDDFAADGFRVLALAGGRSAQPVPADGDDLALLGMVALRDPPRADVGGAIGSLRRAGVEVVMATGDHPATALAIARDVGIAGPGADALTGDRLIAAGDRGDGSAEDLVVGHRVFARVSPEQKLNLIDLFQRHQHVVAMIGDGVNDAPALVKADIGVAMGKRGTEVAREASEMVLLDDRFPTIVTAVREGRVILDNIRRFSTYLLSCNLAEVMVVAVAILAGLPLPLLPLQILFLNLVTDVFPAFALASSEAEEDVLERPPRPPREPIITGGHWRMMSAYATAIAGSTLLALWAAGQWLGLDTAAARTVSFLTLALAQLWHVFNMRSARSSLLGNAVVRNRFVWYALALCAALVAAAVLVPPLADALQTVHIGAAGWALAVGASLIPLAVGQLWLTVAGRSGAD